MNKKILTMALLVSSAYGMYSNLDFNKVRDDTAKHLVGLENMAKATEDTDVVNLYKFLSGKGLQGEDLDKVWVRWQDKDSLHKAMAVRKEGERTGDYQERARKTFQIALDKMKNLQKQNFPSQASQQEEAKQDIISSQSKASQRSSASDKDSADLKQYLLRIVERIQEAAAENTSSPVLLALSGAIENIEEGGLPQSYALLHQFRDKDSLHKAIAPRKPDERTGDYLRRAKDEIDKLIKAIEPGVRKKIEEDFVGEGPGKRLLSSGLITGKEVDQVAEKTMQAMQTGHPGTVNAAKQSIADWAQKELAKAQKESGAEAILNANKALEYEPPVDKVKIGAKVSAQRGVEPMQLSDESDSS